MLSKKEQNALTREMLYEKYSGKCALCGDHLPEKWHVWEIEPSKTLVSLEGNLVIGNTSYENKLPACISCNATRLHNSPDKNLKIDIEQFRSALYDDLAFLKTSTYYRKEIRYGMICETKEPIVFYFERHT
jgi:hypothetical protein